MQAFLDVGFILREDVVKYQWKTKTTREKWGGLTKVADECWVDIDKEKNITWTSTCYIANTSSYLEKLRKNEDIKAYKESMKWWKKQLNF